MTLINIGINFEEAQEAANKARQPAPIGVYHLRVCEIIEKDENDEPLKTKKNGKPQFIAVCEIQGNADAMLNGKKVRQYVTLPSRGDLSSVGFLVDFARACGKSWSGGQFDPQDCLYSEFDANLSISKDGKWNNIESYV